MLSCVRIDFKSGEIEKKIMLRLNRFFLNGFFPYSVFFNSVNKISKIWKRIYIFCVTLHPIFILFISYFYLSLFVSFIIIKLRFTILRLNMLFLFFCLFYFYSPIHTHTHTCVSFISEIR